MTSTDIATREEKALALIESGAFAERVEPLLPDTVTVSRFVTVAKTAIRTTPGLANAEQKTLMGALIRCAQDGLLPDGREAALNVYSGKVSYLPMIGGLRKVLAEYGWTLKTRVVRGNDDFEYVEEPPMLRHVPTRPGVDGGPMIAAYAVARHTDGRKLQIVLDAEEIAKRKAVAKTDNVWEKWPEAMWEKSAGHAIFDEIPRAERDRMIVPSDNGVESAVELLYGPDGHEFPVRPTTEAGDPVAALPLSSGSAQKGDRDSQQAEPAELPDSAAGSAPGPDQDPEPQPAAEVLSFDDLSATVVPGGGAWGGKTLGEVAESQDGREWIVWALRNKGRFDADFHAAVEAFSVAMIEAEQAAA